MFAPYLVFFSVCYFVRSYPTQHRPLAGFTAANVNVDTVIFASDVSAMADVCLPEFWRHSPQEWFIHAEAIFYTQRVSADLVRVNHVLAALDEDGVRIVSDLLGPEASYSLMKHRLIAAYAVPRATRFCALMRSAGMDDRRPSQLLRYMRSVLPEGIDEAALKEFWLLKLPSTVRAIVSGHDGTPESLAERADRVADASVGHDVPAVNSCESSRLSSIESAISTLTAQISALATSRDRSHSRPGNGSRCYFHSRFGNDARNCKYPCSYAVLRN